MQARERLHQAFADDREVTEVLAEAQRNRAEIRRELGRSLDRAGDREAAMRQFRAAIPETERGIALRRAIAAYRTVPTDDEQNSIGLAHALSRHGTLLADIADLDGSLVARREAVARYRQHLGSEGRLWQNRNSQGTTWVSTPTWERWCDTAVDLAHLLKMLRIDAAPEALLLFQDAAEGYAALVPDHMFNRLLPGTQGHVARMDRTVAELEAWLAELGHGDLADLYRRTAYTLVTQGGGRDWPGVLRNLRPALDAALPP